ncbi:MAG: PEP-CTERM sorting domain-containing protein [Planctomycetota bacterium]
MGTAAADTISFPDGDFASAAWTNVTLDEDEPQTETIARILTSGNPDVFRQHTIDVGDLETGPDTAGLIGLDYLTGASFDPSTSGAVNFLQYTYDAKFISSTKTFGFLSFRPFLEQDGKIYLGNATISSGPGLTNSWTSFASGSLTTTDFQRLFGFGPGDPTDTPDFSSSGGLMDFGYLVAYSAAGGLAGTPFTMVHGIDNFEVTADFTAPTTQPIPEPSTLALFGMAGVGAVAWRWRRRKKAA